MRLTIWLVSFAFMLVMLMFFQAAVLRMAEPAGALLLVLTVVAIPFVALLEALGVFVGFARWIGSDK